MILGGWMGVDGGVLSAKQTHMTACTAPRADQVVNVRIILL